MVIITRSAYRRACESTNSSNVSENNIIPPWCSSGKVKEKRKPRVVPSWEIRSSYPIRENIWEFLCEKERDSRAGAAALKPKKRCNCKLKGRSEKRKTTAVIVGLIFVTAGIIASIWMNSLPKISLLGNVTPKEKLISLRIQATSVGEECCHKMRYLAAELSRVEQALRHSERIRRTLAITSQITGAEYADTDRKHVEGATITRGRDTEEYWGRLALWGVVPLWRAAPPPDTVLAARKPTPSDCWPFVGSRGELFIQLPRSVQIRTVSLEHIRPDTARSAPKHFVFYGILENSTWVNAVKGEYMDKGPAKQFYRFNWGLPLRKLVFRVLSNQGNTKYTCLYRVHFYGNNYSYE